MEVQAKPTPPHIPPSFLESTFFSEVKHSMYKKTLWIKEKYLNMILNGKKTIEVRVGYSNITRLQPGDLLILNDQYPYKINRIARYDNFEVLLTEENPEAIAPGLSKEALLQALHELYPPEKEGLGVVALEIAPVTT